MDYSGQTLEGRYCIIRLLGKGGMGSVWLGQHMFIGRSVAVKFLKKELADSEEMVKRFYREAQAAAAVAHSNIIDILDVGVSSAGDPYIVMEYLEGETLSSMLRRTGPIDLSAALAVLEPVLLALSAAHEKGIIHRDLKPENVFLSHPKDEPLKIKLIDFGISKIVQSNELSKLTNTGVFIGTPSYVSPEQIRGDKTLDHRADLYSIGVILYEMLTGKLPIKGEHHNAMVVSVLTEDPLPPWESYPDFPMEAEAIVMRLLSKKPACRPESAKQLLEEIKLLESYETRKEHLSRYAFSIEEKRCACGYLGLDVGTGSLNQSAEDGKIAHEVLAEISAEASVSDWSKSIATRKRCRRLFFGSVIGVAVVVLAITVFLVLRIGNSEVERKLSAITVSQTASPPIPKAEAVSAPLRVRITVMGMPEGAKLFFDGKERSRSRFLTAFSTDEKTLKVSAQGFSDFVRNVRPAQNVIIEVAMKPTPQKAAKNTTSSSSPKGRRVADKTREENSIEKNETETGVKLMSWDGDKKKEASKKFLPEKLVKTEDGKKAVSSFE